MLASIQSNQGNPAAFKHSFTAEQRLRTDGVPVGILNVGNTCYFNSLMQTYFHLPTVVEKVLNFKIPAKDQKEQGYAQMKFIEHVQKMFVRMIKSNQKFVDPSDVLGNMTDSFGETIKFADGNQKDIHEFHCQFIESMNEALNIEKITALKLKADKIDESASNAEVLETQDQPMEEAKDDDQEARQQDLDQSVKIEEMKGPLYNQFFGKLQ